MHKVKLVMCVEGDVNVGPPHYESRWERTIELPFPPYRGLSIVLHEEREPMFGLFTIETEIVYDPVTGEWECSEEAPEEWGKIPAERLKQIFTTARFRRQE